MRGRVTNVKKASIIGSAALVGLIAITGTAYGVNQHNYKVNLTHAKVELKSERGMLSALKPKIAQLEPDAEGFLPKGASVSKLNSYKKSVNNMKDSYIDFDLAKSDLKSQFTFIRLDKKSLLREIQTIQTAYTRESAINSLFTSPAIIGDHVQSQSIKSTITQAKVTKVGQLALSGVSSNSPYAKAVASLIKDAKAQVKQLEAANQSVNGLYAKGKVKSGVSLSTVSKAKASVSKVKNPSVKSALLAKVNNAFKVVSANSKSQAESQAKKTGGSVVKHSDGSYTVSAPPTKSSSGVSSSSASRSSSSSGSSSGLGSTYSAPVVTKPATSSGGSNGSSSGSSGQTYSSSKPSSSSGKQGNSTVSHSSGSSTASDPIVKTSKIPHTGYTEETGGAVTLPSGTYLGN